MIKRVFKKLRSNKIPVYFGLTIILVISLALLSLYIETFTPQHRIKVQKINTLYNTISDLENNLLRISPTDIPRERISEETDSIEFIFNEIFPSHLKTENDFNLNDISSHEKTFLYTEKLINNILLYSNEIQFKNIVKDTTENFYAFQTYFDEKTQTFKKGFVEKSRTLQILKPKYSFLLLNASVDIKKTKKQLSSLLSYYNQEAKEDVKYLVILSIFFAASCLLCIYILYMFLNKNYYEPLGVFSKLHKDIKKEQYTLLEAPLNNEFDKVRLTINKFLMDMNGAISYIEEFSLKRLDTNNEKFSRYLNSDSPLAKALKKMSKNLNEIALQEERRNWVIQGASKFNSMLNKVSGDLDNNYDKIINEIVIYCGALQGALFLVELDDKNEEVLTMKSVFAYDRNKRKRSNIRLGEGIVGQCWEEKKEVVIDDLPTDHMAIKSGLGAAKPKSLIVFPILEGEKIHGVIEVASFKIFEEHHLDFIKNVSENFATYLSSAESSRKTQLLLKESQELTRKMREQEEERKQNLEMLQAAQEEVEKRELIKENQIQMLRRSIKEKESSYEEEKKNHLLRINQLESEIKHALEDNEKIRALEKEVNALKQESEQQLLDLNETLKIKDMRIEKLRNKLQKKTNES